MFAETKDTVEEIRVDFEIPSDLSETAYETARTMLASKYKEIREDSWGDLYLPRGKGVVTLTVGFWDADLAIDLMGKYRNCHVVVSRDMEPDAFSVTLNLFHTKIIAYSPGA